MQIDARLENWYTYTVSDRTYVCGLIYDDTDKRWDDGTEVTTSRVESSADAIKEGSIITTRNSTYLLGKEYKSCCLTN